MSWIQEAVSGLVEPMGSVVKEFVVDKDKQIEMQHKLEMMITQGVADARAHDKASYGITFVDAVRGLVRPVITAMTTSTFIYCTIKGIPLSDVAMTVLNAPMVFWFGGRYISKDKKG